MTSRRLWLGFAVTGAFLAVLFLKIDLDGMRSALAEANYVYLLPAVLVYFASFYARAVRWRYVLGPFARVRANRLYPVIMVGYMANNVLPMRLGEVARSYYLSTREPVRASTALATVVIERVFDGLTLLFFLAAAALFLPVPGLADRMADSVSVPVWLLAIAVIAPFVGVLFLMVTAAVYPDVFLRVARWITTANCLSVSASAPTVSHNASSTASRGCTGQASLPLSSAYRFPSGSWRARRTTSWPWASTCRPISTALA